MKFLSGLPETSCGRGSTLASTENIRQQLPALLRQLCVRTLVDAGCGDFNWMRRMDLSGIQYIGVDIDPPREGGDGVSFLCGNIVTDPLPRGDVVLCRDVLQHLPTHDVQRFLENFLHSGSPWLLATNHAGARNVNMTEPGGFELRDLTASPFGILPLVAAEIEDAAGEETITAHLCLWPRRSVYAYCGDTCPGHVGSLGDRKICAHCGTHVDAMRPPESFEP